MTDYSELKRLAEHHINLHGDTWHAEESKALESLPTFSSEWFVAAASPKAVLALIAENERLSQSPAQQVVTGIAVAAAAYLAQEAKGCLESGLFEQIDQLKAEVEALRTALSDARPYVAFAFSEGMEGAQEAGMKLDAAMRKEGGQ